MLQRYLIFTLFCICLLSCMKKQENIIFEETEHLIDVDTSNLSNTIIEESLNEIMYVNALSGLRVRSLPNIHSEIIGLLDNRTKVIIVEEGDGFMVIEGIYNKWVYINSPIEGWIFRGFLDDGKKSSQFVSEGFGFRYDLREYESRTTFIENHGIPINITEESTINAHNNLEDKIITLEYDNFIVSFYEWNEKFEGYNQLRILEITSKDNIEYLFGVRHGMEMKDLINIFGEIERGSTGIWLENPSRNGVFIDLENDIVNYIKWFNYFE